MTCSTFHLGSTGDRFSSYSIASVEAFFPRCCLLLFSCLSLLLFCSKNHFHCFSLHPVQSQCTVQSNEDSSLQHVSSVQSKMLLCRAFFSSDTDTEVHASVYAFCDTFTEGGCWHSLSFCTVAEGVPQACALLRPASSNHPSRYSVSVPAVFCIVTIVQPYSLRRSVCASGIGFS